MMNGMLFVQQLKPVERAIPMICISEYLKKVDVPSLEKNNSTHAIGDVWEFNAFTQAERAIGKRNG